MGILSNLYLHLPTPSIWFPFLRREIEPFRFLYHFFSQIAIRFAHDSQLRRWSGIAAGSATGKRLLCKTKAEKNGGTRPLLPSYTNRYVALSSPAYAEILKHQQTDGIYPLSGFLTSCPDFSDCQRQRQFVSLVLSDLIYGRSFAYKFSQRFDYIAIGLNNVTLIYTFHHKPTKQTDITVVYTLQLLEACSQPYFSSMHDASEHLPH